MSASVVTLSSAADIVAAVPALLGYTPEESVVVVHLGDRSVGCLARCDASILIEAGDQANQVIDDSIITIVAQRESVTSVILIGYGTSGAEFIAGRPNLAMAPLSVPVREEIIVVDGRWASMCTCEDRTSCEGEVDSAGRAGLEVAAATGSIGNIITRSDFERMHDPNPITLPTVESLSHDDQRDSWKRILTDEWTAHDLAVVSSATDHAARDSVVCYFGTAKTNDIAAGYGQEWEDWVLALPALPKDRVTSSLLGAARAGNTAMLWAVYAHAVWAAGDGAATNIAIDHGAVADPSYRLLLLLQRLVQLGVQVKESEPRWVA